MQTADIALPCAARSRRPRPCGAPQAIQCCRRGIKELGILTALRIDRREVGSPGEFERPTDDELQRWIAAETARLIELPGDEP